MLTEVARNDVLAPFVPSTVTQRPTANAEAAAGSTLV
jgi:hypothetical protein